MEAQSAGIPVIATSVGGIPEIVNDNNGLLMPADPTPADISKSLLEVVLQKQKWKQKGVVSRMDWENNFKAENNYRYFAEQILEFYDSERADKTI